MFQILSKRVRALAGLILVAGLFPDGAASQVAVGEIPKQVDLVVDGDRLVASNVRFSRFDELKLRGRESVRETRVGEAVIIVITNQRIIAYGLLSGWRWIDLRANEQIESVTAEDFAGLIVTSERMLNFNGQTGSWGERPRRLSR